MDAINGWREWSKYVLKSLENISSELDGVQEKVEKINISLKVLQKEVSIKSSIWGAIGGVLPMLSFLLLWLLKDIMLGR